MTDIEAKALALVNEARRERDMPVLVSVNRKFSDDEAICRAIEQREILNAENQQLAHDLERQMTIANEHVEELATFRQRVSDAVKDACKFAKDNPVHLSEYLVIRFSFIIIPKLNADPLAEALKSLAWDAETSASQLRARLDAFGFEIREKKNVE
jgi:hypothetical protein